MRRLLYAALSLGAVLLSTTILGLQPASATTGTSGYCTSSKGVTVIADFTSLGGGVEIRCDPTATASTDGLDALHGAGFSTTPTQHDGPGFVCRINNQPSSDNCINTPPATMYWSYWSAPNGGSWTYSTQGVLGHKVIVGGMEGWRFYNANDDGKTAPPPHASTTRPVPVVKPTFHMGPAASLTAKPKPSHSASTTSTATKTASPTTSATPTDTATTPDGTSTSASTQAGGALPGDGPSSGSSPWPFVFGIGAVALIGAGAFLVVQRRRVGGY